MHDLRVAMQGRRDRLGGDCDGTGLRFSRLYLLICGSFEMIPTKVHGLIPENAGAWTGYPALQLRTTTNLGFRTREPSNIVIHPQRL